MQKVSKQYKENIRLPSRNRGYIMVSFGLLNQEAQAKARIESGVFSYYSNKDYIFEDQNDKTVYATLEEDFTKIDGSMIFLPRQSRNASYYNTGIISRDLVSDGDYTIYINLHTLPIDFKGITILFGENYPVDFDMSGDDGTVHSYKDNDKSLFTTEDVLRNTQSVTLTFHKMKNEHSRLRIYYIRFGYGLVYKNNDVIESTLDSYVSPIGEDVPQIDFSVTLQNYDQYFNVDNPNSAINFFETGQTMEVYYGYDVSGEGDIEWIKGGTLLCSEWSSDDFTATVRGQDVYRNMESEYNFGRIYQNGISYYDLALQILQDAGEKQYYIDPRLKHLYTRNPVPRVRHKEALQIIANACRCTLSQTRDGGIQIKSNFQPEIVSVTSPDEAPYSNVASVKNKTDKQEYATFADDYSVVDGKIYFVPRSLKRGIETGFVSKQISDDNGKFDSNPVVTIVQDAQCMYYGMSLTFGNALPSGIIIHTYNNNVLVADYNVTDDTEITQRLVLTHVFDDFDTMKIEFTGTQTPHNRIVFNSFVFGDNTDFTIERNDMLSSPKAIKQELVKEVVVPCYSYQLSNKEDNLISEDTTVTSGTRATYYIGDASYGFSASLKTIVESGEGTPVSGVSVVDSGAYYVTVQFSVSGKYHLDIKGYKYNVVERDVVKTLHVRGKSVKWSNPLMSDMDMAQDLADWLSDYYKSGIEYEYDYRGYPELDVNDIVYQENSYHPSMKVNVYRNSLTFNGAFGGKITARRQGE